MDCRQLEQISTWREHGLSSSKIRAGGCAQGAQRRTPWPPPRLSPRRPRRSRAAGQRRAPRRAPAVTRRLPRSDIELAVVKSPIVGTFYRSPEPGAPSFVEIGTTVKKGQVLCIIEAMKLMNEIDSEYDGEVVNVYVENGQPVQYGERLFAIRTK